MIVKKYWTKNPYALDGKYLSGSAFTGFFLHSVATPQSDAQVFIAGRDKSNYTSSGVNGFVDDKAAWLTLPSLETKGKVKRAPHAGRPANDHYIGFEMCEPNQIQYNTNHTKIIGCTDFDAAYAYVKKVYANAVELFAELCIFHGKDPLEKGVIYSHKEGHAAGVATNHGDPDQLWSYFDKTLTMDKFRADVAARMKELAKGENADDEQEETEVRYYKLKEVPKYYRPTLDKLIDKKLFFGEGGEGEERIVNITEDACKVLTINDRAGLYGE